MKCHLKSAGESSLNVYLLGEFNLFTQTYIFLALRTSFEVNNIGISWQRIFLSPSTSISHASCTFQTWYILGYISTDKTHETWNDTKSICYFLVKFPIPLLRWCPIDNFIGKQLLARFNQYLSSRNYSNRLQSRKLKTSKLIKFKEK